MVVRRYRYKECGLDNVVLLNGFKLRNSPYGKVISIERIEDLHRTIGRSLIREKKTLNGNEIRFLRHELKFSQNRLAALLGVDEQTVARWEKGKVQISGPGDKMIRILYNESVDGDTPIKKILNDLAELDTYIDRDFLFEEGDDGWRPARAA